MGVCSEEFIGNGRRRRDGCGFDAAVCELLDEPCLVEGRGLSWVWRQAELSGLLESIEVMKESVDFDFVGFGLAVGFSDGEIEVCEGVQW